MSKKILLGAARLGSFAAGIYFSIRIGREMEKDRIFINGSILTMNNNNDIVQAVAIKRGRIVAAGSNEEVRRHARRSTTVVDLGGKTMIPGFVDAHSHFPGAGLDAVAEDINSPPIGAIENIPQMIEALKKRAGSRGSGKWILGYGYDDTMLEEMRHPTRHDLDRVSRDRPVAIAHISWHMVVVNTAGLDALGIDENTEPPAGGVIRREPGGAPSGVLEETATHALMEQAMDFTIFEQFDIMKRSAEKYAAAGVTTAQNGFTEKKLIMPFSLMSRAGLMPLRLVLWPGQEAWDEELAAGRNFNDKNSDMLEVGAVKLFADGSIQAYTGYLSEPYHEPFNGDADYRGYPIHDREKLAGLVVDYHCRGLQVAIHGNGDAAIDDIIHAVEKAQVKCPRSDPRHLLIHGQMARPDQLDRMKQLGISPSFHAIHPYYWGDRHRDIFLGPGRALRISPMRTALEKGLRFSAHLDTPVVPMSPLFCAWVAVNRESSSGEPIGRDEALTPMQALRSLTIDAAWQVFQEHNRGSIEKGKFADLVILSENPLENPGRIKDIEVLETIVGGMTVARDSSLRSE